jgi:hypothetical protein
MGANASANLPREEFAHRIHGLGVPYGREDSFKLTRSLVLADRTLLGMRTKGLTCANVLATCRSLDMPKQYEEVIETNYGNANVVLFGLEPRDDGSTVKVYLEFWDAVRQRVRETGSRTPLLLNLGVKWEPGHSLRHGLARYTCFPLLTAGEAIGRIDALLADSSREIASAGLGLVRLAAQRAPGSAFVYLECEEDGNPRRSYDINLYKSALRLADGRVLIDQACAHFGCAPETVWNAPGLRADRRLGHLSGGSGSIS